MLETVVTSAAKTPISKYIKNETLVYESDKRAREIYESLLKKDGVPSENNITTARKYKKSGAIPLFGTFDEESGTGTVSIKDTEYDVTHAKIKYKIENNDITFISDTIPQYIADKAEVLDKIEENLRLKHGIKAPDLDKELEADVGRILPALLKVKITTTETAPDGLAETAQIEGEKRGMGAVVPKGATLGVKNGEREIFLGKARDNSTLPHEILHAWVRDKESGGDLRTLSRIERELLPLAPEGTKPGIDWTKDYVFTGRDQKTRLNAHEKLAELWEDYLAGERRGIPERLKDFFDRLAKAIRHALKNEGAQVPEAIEKIFDEIIGADKSGEGIRPVSYLKQNTGKLAVDNNIAEGETAAKSAGQGGTEGSNQTSSKKKAHRMDEHKNIKHYFPNDSMEALKEQGRAADIVEIDPSVMLDENGQAIDYKASREIKKWFTENLVGQEVTIDDDGRLQEFTKKGLEASLKRTRQENHNEMYGQLKTLLKNALFDKQEAADKRHEGSVKGQRIYYSAARIGGDIYSVKIRLDVPLEGDTLNYKDHKVKDIEITPDLYRTHGTQGNLPTIPQTSGDISAVGLDVLNGTVKPSIVTDGTLFSLVDAYRGTTGKITDSSRDGGAVYGAGRYMSSREAVGRAYARKTGIFDDSAIVVIDGKEYDTDDSFATSSIKTFMDIWHNDVERVKEILASPVKNEAQAVAYKEALRLLKNAKEVSIKEKGRLYRAKIEDKGLADWGNSFEKDSPVLKKLLAKTSPLSELTKQLLKENPGGFTYEQIYRGLASELGSNRAASRALMEAGIPGHKYLGEYKNAGEGKDVENYVIYDESVVSEPEMLFSLRVDSMEALKEQGRAADIVEIDPSVMLDENGQAIDYKASREIKKWFTENLVGQEVTIDDDGRLQEFTKKGLEASLKKRRKEHHNEVYGQLNPLIKNALFDHEEAANAKHATTLDGQRIYYSAANIGGKTYGVKLRLDIPKGKTTLNFKDLDIKKIDIASVQSPTPADNQSALRLAHTGAISAVSLDVLNGSVKPSIVTDGTLFSLIGEKGAAALDKAQEATTRLDNLSVARKMEAAGKDAKVIRLATGWERGADKKWRYEIPDEWNYDKEVFDNSFKKEGAFNPKKEKYRTLGELLPDADLLFKAYPKLKEVYFYRNRYGGRAASFNSINNAIELGDSVLDVKGSILHEVQHAIQLIEGFAPGGTPGLFTSTHDPMYEELKSLYKNYERNKGGYSDFYAALEKNYLSVEDNRLRNFIKRRKEGEITEKVFKENIDSFLKEDTRSPYQKYLSLPGETEARNVQARKNLTEKERRERLLSETEDVAREDRIFLQSIGESLFSLRADPNKDPIGYLKQNAEQLADKYKADQAEVERQLDELAKQYPPETNAYKEPNGKPTNLTRAQWYTVRTPFFKKWFGDWEAAALINTAERVWNGGTNKERFNFAPSEKLKAELQKLQGKDIDSVFITGSDIGHIKNRHSENQKTQGQVDITPEDIALIPFVMNEFDTATIGDNNAVVFTKQINGEAYAVSYNRGEHKEQLVTFWKKKSGAASATKSPFAFTSETAPHKETIQKAKDLRNAAKNASKVVDENGAPLVVYHGTGADFDTFENHDGLPAYYFDKDKKYAEGYARMKGDAGGIVMPVFLNIKNPVELSADEIGKDNIEAYTGGEYDGAYSAFHGIYVAFSPEQIKSATDNAGTYGEGTRGENGDSILFSLSQQDKIFEYQNVIEDFGKKHGYKTKLDFSNSSQSSYVTLWKDDEEGDIETDEIKVRLSDHELPDKYAPPDIDISVLSGYGNRRNEGFSGYSLTDGLKKLAKMINAEADEADLKAARAIEAKYDGEFESQSDALYEAEEVRIETDAIYEALSARNKYPARSESAQYILDYAAEAANGYTDETEFYAELAKLNPEEGDIETARRLISLTKRAQELPDPDEEAALFQLSEDEILADAAKYKSPEEWRAAVEGAFDIDEEGAIKETAAASVPENLTEEETTAWYEYVWERAREGRRGEESHREQSGPLKTSELDEYFLREKVGTPEQRNDFYKIIAATQNTGDMDAPVETEEEYNERESRILHGAMVRKLLPGNFYIGANKTDDRRLKPKQIAAMDSFLRSHPTQMRVLYTELTGDEDLLSMSDGEIRDRPYIFEAMESDDNLSMHEIERLALDYRKQRYKRAGNFRRNKG